MLKDLLKIFLGQEPSFVEQDRLREQQSRAFSTEVDTGTYREYALREYEIKDIQCGYIDRDNRKILRVNRDEYKKLIQKFCPKEILVKLGRIFDEGRSASFLFTISDGISFETFGLMPSCEGTSVLQQTGLNYREINPPAKTQSETTEWDYGSHKFIRS